MQNILQNRFKISFLIAVIFVCIIGFFLYPKTNSKSRLISPLSDKKIAEILTPTLIITPTRSPTPPLTPTPTPSPTPIPIPLIAPADLEALFTKFSSEYSVDKERLKRIANCESSFNPGASSSGYAGLFQFSEGLWIQTRNLIGLNSDVNLRYNAEESIRTAAFMMSQGHFGIWPNCNK